MNEYGHSYQERVWHAYLIRALVLLTGNDRLGQHGIHGELRHPPPKLRQFTSVVQCTQRIQQLQSPHERLAWWRIHELEADQVVDSQ